MRGSSTPRPRMWIARSPQPVRLSAPIGTSPATCDRGGCAAAAAIEEHSEQLASTLVRTIGKPQRAAVAEVGRGAAVFRLAAEEIVRFGGETIPVDGVPGGEDRWSLTFHEPHGVAALVTPFNAPINLLAQKLAPAIAVGNASVVKPSFEGGAGHKSAGRHPGRMPAS